jgi:integrase
MATLSTDHKTGLREIRYFDGDKRPTIRLGRMPKKTAERVLTRIEDLIFAKQSQTSPSAETAEWVAGLTGKLRKRLEELGLIHAPADSAQENQPGAGLSLGVFLDDLIERRRGTAKPASLIVYGHTRRCLVEFFGEDKPLAEITAGDAQNWRLWLKSHEKLGDNTIRRRCGFAKQFFKAAVDHEYLARNPFGILKGVTVRGVKERFHFVADADARKVLDACPNAEWRVLFALSRWGGLRCPSEHLALRWGEVNWSENKIIVRSPKTEHLPGKAYRVVPLFNELREPLEELWEQTPKGTTFVINRYRDPKQNLRTQLTKIILRAGLKPWAKLWHNLRATRQTELAQQGFPMHVICDWIGNSPEIAAEHYLRTTEADFQRALSMTEKNPGQNPGQYTTEMPENASNDANARKSKNEKTPKKSGFRGEFEIRKVDDTGLEPVTSTMSTTDSIDFCGNFDMFFGKCTVWCTSFAKKFAKENHPQNGSSV